MGAIRFGVPRELVLWLRERFKIDCFVETGTNKAETTAWAADHFAQVITIEGMKETFEAAVAAHGHRRNIRFLCGDSRVLLGEVLETLAKPAILWLDAHWCGDGTFGPATECPLMDELASANRSRLDNIVLIDDARLFTAPPPRPHKPDGWPDLIATATALSGGPTPRYAAIHQDVIVAVSAERRLPLVEYLRSAPQPPPARSLRSSIGAALRKIGLLSAPNRKGSQC